MLLDIEPGAEHLYPFAKKKLADLKQQCELAGIPSLQKHFTVDTGETIDIATRFGKDAIKISGGLRNALYSWAGYYGAFYGARDFNIGGSVDASAVPWMHRVSGVKLTALGTQLSFTLATRGPDPWDLADLVRFKTILAGLVKSGDWLAVDGFRSLLQSVPVKWRGVTLSVDVEECMLSPADSKGIFWLLIGRFPAPSGAFPTALGTVTFTGIRVPWDAFKVALKKDSSTHLVVVDLDSRDVVRDPDGVPKSGDEKTVQDLVVDMGTGYTRTERASTFNGDHVFRIVPANVSPFSAVYQEITTALGSMYTRHQLEVSGDITIADAAAGIVSGTTNMSAVFTRNVNSQAQGSWTAGSISSMNCDITIFDGERFVKVGECTFTGGSSSTPGSTPVNSRHATVMQQGVGNGGFGGQLDYTRYQMIAYVREYNMLVTAINTAPFGTVSVSYTTDPFANVVDYPNAIVLNNIGPPISAETMVVLNPFPYNDFNPGGSEMPVGKARGFNQGPVLDHSGNYFAGAGSAMVYPQASAAPNVGAYQTAAVYWHRLGKPLGVLVFRTPTDPTAWNADVVKYRHVYHKDVGYRRITNPDGTFTLEPGYEDLEVILGRIMAAIIIVVNNFASPALIPWLSVGLNGVIMGVA